MSEMSVVFFHVPKTGGTTMNFILNNIYKMKFLWLRNDIIIQQSNYIHPLDIFHRMPQNKLKIFKAISGHQILPLIDQLPPTFKKLLLVRNPLQQIPSLYSHHLRNESNSPSNKEFRSYSSFNDFLKSKSDYYPNPQVKSLFFYNLEIMNNSNEAKKAIIRLVNNKIDLCGTTDQFEKFLSLACEELNWNKFSYTIRNQNPDSQNYSPDFKKQIRDSNELDFFLYDQVVQKFQRLLNTHQSNRKFKTRDTYPTLYKIINKIQQHRVTSMASLQMRKELQLKSVLLKYFTR